MSKLTFGDYEERCNVPNAPIMHRCGICGDAFDTKSQLNRHHRRAKEQKYTYHEPARVAGGLCYLVDAQGFRVNDRGRRY